MLAGCGLGASKKDETVGWSAQRLYSEAKDRLNERMYTEAIELFEKLEARYPYGRHAQQAQMEVAYAYYKDREPEQALAAADRFIRLHPNHPGIDYMYYLKGLVWFNEDQSMLSNFFPQDMTERDPRGALRSYDAFKDLVDRFPESRYTPDARARMGYLVNALAQHEVHVARYYMRRADYVAAANRAQHAIRTYPEAPAVEEATAVLMDAYAALGLDDLSADARRVLEQNFPDSSYRDGHFVDRPAWWKIW